MLTIHEDQKALIAYNPHGHTGIIVATPPDTVAWNEVNAQGACVHDHEFITEGMREQWDAIGEPVLSVWEGAIHVDATEEDWESEWHGTFRRAEVEDLVVFGLLEER